MKIRTCLWGLIVFVTASGLWFGWAARRAHRQLVTLDVIEMPLSKVLRKIEWQTWQKLRAENSISGVRVSLHVQDKPLPYVLDRLSAQAGAHWSKLYAVYGSSRALSGLDAALRGDGRLKPAGWMQMAPAAPEREPAGPGGAPTAGHRQLMLFRRTKDGATIVETAGGKTDAWSPEELVVDSSVGARLGNGGDLAPTARAAAAAARKAGGDWTTYFAFSKSPIGFGFGSTSSFGQGHPGLAGPLPYNPNDRFANLTPEGRVRLARALEQNGGRVTFTRH